MYQPSSGERGLPGPIRARSLSPGEVERFSASTWCGLPSGSQQAMMIFGFWEYVALSATHSRHYTRRNCSVTELNVFDGADGCLPRDRAGGRGVGVARGSTAGIKKWSFSFIRLRSQRACWKKRATFIDSLRSFATEFDATVSPVALHRPRPRHHLPTTPRHQLGRLRKVEFHVSFC